MVAQRKTREDTLNDVFDFYNTTGDIPFMIVLLENKNLDDCYDEVREQLIARYLYPEDAS